MNESEQKGEPAQVQPARHKVRLPGFLNEESIGLGDLVKKATYSVGIKPCGGCEKRAAAMNRWMSLGSVR